MKRNLRLVLASLALIGGGAVAGVVIDQEDQPQTVTAVEVPVWWKTKLFTLPSGRTYYAMVPTCNPAPCTEPRQVMVFSHGLNGPETLYNATVKLNEFHTQGDPDAVFVYAVSKGGTKRFDARFDYCCTWVDTDEVQYLMDVTAHLAAQTPVDPAKVGLFGYSNGGMLTERAVCLRPDVFVAGASWAGTWKTSATETCMVGQVDIRQWHGEADTVAPINGGPVTVDGHTFILPSASALRGKILPESTFTLTRIPGEDHVPPGWVTRDMIAWLNTLLGT